MAHQPVKFLLVDDLDANLLALEGLLRREGLEMHMAHSGPEALELLLRHDFALALVDVQMPEMNGFELAETMRSTERTRRVPIIFITAGIVDAQRRFRGYEAGAVDFLFKPVEPHILRTKAGVFFELYNQRNELMEIAQENAELLAESRHAEEELRAVRDQLARVNIELEEKVRQRTAKLMETVGELEHFSYTITHDMRAPLRAMQAFGVLLTQDKSEQLDEEGKDFLRRIIQSAQRMDSLITDSLDYTKLVRTEFDLRPIDPEPLLRSMVESYPEFQPPNLEVEIEGTLPRVLANAAGLTQCFSNLLTNAVKFVQPGRVPHVRIRAEPRKASGPEKNGNVDFVRLWVEDNGIGIPRDQQQRIFQMFQRLDQKKEGTGIGLALVKKAAERMKGRAGVESEPGVGSRFWIEFQAASTSAGGEEK